MTDHAVGSKISLISKSEIRYEGYLHFINPDENTVALKNVRMFGTEGRKNGTGEIPANEQLYEFIIFRGADIKDLTVFEDQPQDPAIVSAKAAAPGAVESKPSRPLGDDWNTSGGRGRGGAPRRYESRPGDNRFERHREQRFDGGRGGDGGIDSYGGRRGGGGGGGGGGGRFYDRRDNYGGGGGGGHGGGHHSGGGGHGGHGGHGGGRGGYDRPQRVEHTGREFAPSTDGKAKQEFSEDFDFAKAKQEFETKAHKEKDGSAKKSYDKTSSFFDTISCETSERIARGGRRPDNLREQRERQHGIDNETFGRDLVGQQQQRRRGGGRGRGRFGNRY